MPTDPRREQGNISFWPITSEASVDGTCVVASQHKQYYRSFMCRQKRHRWALLLTAKVHLLLAEAIFLQRCYSESRLRNSTITVWGSQKKKIVISALTHICLCELRGFCCCCCRCCVFAHISNNLWSKTKKRDVEHCAPSAVSAPWMISNE